MREQLGDGLAALIVAAGKEVRVLQDFTNDRELLIKTIQAPPADPGAPPDPFTQTNNLRKASDMLAAFPQKKALVYFSRMGGATGDDALMGPALAAAVRANVAIYPVDVRGLPGTLPVSATSRIAAADSVTLTVDNHSIDGSYAVKADGMLSIPQLGDMKAAGLTPIELRAVINDRLVQAGILQDPHAELEVTRTPTPGK